MSPSCASSMVVMRGCMSSLLRLVANEGRGAVNSAVFVDAMPFCLFIFSFFMVRPRDLLSPKLLY